MVGYFFCCIFADILIKQHIDMSEIKELEFQVGDTVTLDRYNHIDDVERVKIIDIRESWGPSDDMDYIMDVNGVEIRSSGVSIMESKHYMPVPDEDRHCRKNASIMEQESYWDRVLNKFKK